MDIRPVKADEIDGVLCLIDEYDRPKSPHPSREDARAIYDSIVGSGGCIVGAFGSEGVVGTCTVDLCANLSWGGRPYGMVENVIVSRGYRNQGIGKRLLGFAVDYSRDAGCYKVCLMTGSSDPAVHPFYEGVGFRGDKVGFQVRFG